MTKQDHLATLYAPSDDIVAREIEGELIIVPLAAGIGDMEDELYTLNDTGKAVWRRLDGRTPIGVVIESLRGEFRSVGDEIESDVLGLVAELHRRGMLVEATA